MSETTEPRDDVAASELEPAEDVVEVEPVSEEDDQSNVVPVENRLAAVDDRVRNLEKFAETVKDIATEVLGSWQESQKIKAESVKYQHEMQDGQHKRASWLLGGVMAAVFTLSIIALVRGDSDLVRMIFNSSLAVAAGAGLTSVWRRAKKDE